MSGEVKGESTLTKTDSLHASTAFMFTVYILRSKNNPEKMYIGYTTNLAERLKAHSIHSPNTYIKTYAPWELETYTVFQDGQLAQQFELYLKSHAGRAFLRKHLVINSRNSAK